MPFTNLIMTMTNPITPPPELVQQWLEDGSEHPSIAGYVATQAARWGADQELEACCGWLEQNCGRWELPAALRATRRPKPPTLKEQALEQLRIVNAILQFQTNGGETSIIRRALEALPE